MLVACPGWQINSCGWSLSSRPCVLSHLHARMEHADLKIIFLECPPAIKQKYLSKKRFNLISGCNDHSPWKEAYLRKKKIELSWEKGNIKPKELIGHDDHVVTCLQFDGNRIVSGSDDNTLKV